VVGLVALTGCFAGEGSRLDRPMGEAIDVEPRTGGGDGRVTLAVTSLEPVEADEFEAWRAADPDWSTKLDDDLGPDLDAYLASVDVVPTRGEFTDGQMTGLENEEWALTVDGEDVPAPRLRDDVAPERDEACDPQVLTLAGVLLEDGEATICRLLVAPAGTRPTHVVFTSAEDRGRRSYGAEPVSWLVDAD
jgi:hypothetical protein